MRLLPFALAAAVTASLAACGPSSSSAASAPPAPPRAGAAASAPSAPAGTVSAKAACEALALWESSSASGSVADNASLRSTFADTAPVLSKAFAAWTSDIRSGAPGTASDASFVSLECSLEGVTVFPSASAAPATTAPPVTAGKTVAAFSGSGIENTPKFTVTDTWKLTYSFNCSAFGGNGNFIVSEDGGSDFNGASVNELGPGKSGSTYAYGDAGTHYLQVNSECDWRLSVIDEG